MEWLDRAACAAPGIDPDTFFPGVGETEKAAEAKLICRTCTVAAHCLAWAVDTERGTSTSSRSGIYAGTTGGQRRYATSRRTA